jgi:ribosomal protein S18 acetylase RimI-like enzyme
MINIVIRNIENKDVNKDVIKKLAEVLTYSEPENLEDCIRFWEDWFSDKIPGEKLTIIAEENKTIVGLTRFWRSPFCDNKWLVEGLEVIPTRRKQGIGKAIVNYGIIFLRKFALEKIFVHIRNNNLPSIRLHESLGFQKISNGSINSYGDYKEHIDDYLLN